MNDEKKAELVQEQVVAEKLGVSRDQVREFRRDNLYKDRHFVTGRSIRLTPEGVEAVQERFVGDGADGIEFGEKKAAERHLTGKVSRMYCRNRRILLVRLEDGELQKVRVRDNRKFVIGQEVPIRGKAGEHVWLLDCPHPKRRGRLKWNAGDHGVVAGERVKGADRRPDRTGRE